jgi:hypothetical protein
MLTSPLVTMVALLIGLGGAVVILASLLAGRRPRLQTWMLAAVAVTVAALAVTWPAKLRDSANVLNVQRHDFSGTSEAAARERCLNDIGRPDLVEALSVARRYMPPDAEFVVSSNSPVVSCLVVNMLPRRPVRSSDFDPAVHWALFDGTAAEDVRRETERQERLAEPRRRYLAASDAVILARPEDEVAR